MIKSITEDLEPYELFFLMEKKHKLFDIRTIDNLPVWDIIRYMVSYYLAFKDCNISVNNASRNKLALLLEKSFCTLRSVFTFFLYLRKKTPNFQFGVSKIKNEVGEYYDPYFNSIKDITSGEFTLYESITNKNTYSKDIRCFDVLPLIKKIIGLIPGFISRKNNHGFYSSISVAIDDFFEVELISEAEVNRMLNDFRIEYKFYTFLLRFKKVKRVFVTQNGVQKALFKAAQDLKIPTYEFQHGDIVSSTLLYNYGDQMNNIRADIIYPETLFTFSNVWEFNKHIPSKCVEIGVKHLKFEHSKNTNGSKTITIITSNEYNKVLQKLAIEIAETFKDVKIFYKLHPAQFDSLQDNQIFFSQHRNIEVVSLNKNISDLLSVSDEFVVIYSTVIYEVLQAGKKVYIFKSLNYKAFKDFFNLPNVYLFDSVKDLIKIKENVSLEISNDSIPIFFKPFNASVFQQEIA
jgi:hypothetical protein